jgi:hypothetical protein
VVHLQGLTPEIKFLKVSADGTTFGNTFYQSDGDADAFSVSTMVDGDGDGGCVN